MLILRLFSDHEFVFLNPKNKTETRQFKIKTFKIQFLTFFSMASEFYTMPVLYRTLAFFVCHFYRLASTVPYRVPLKTAKPRTEPFKTEFYTHILL